MVRTRFAPSPTGYLHIGGARTALFNWLFARHHGGRFILRIEDTDAARNTEQARAAIFGGLHWLGLNWDEGPDIGGDCGPYQQSERTSIYDKWFEKLQATGRLYEDGGAWRFRFERRKITLNDLVVGEVTIDYADASNTPDMVVRRSDGSYVFHFVNVVDDLEMAISHVIRGDDHLANTHKHLQLIEAFGEEPPAYAHLPLILNPSGGKMSKRDVGASLQSYLDEGYLPAGVVNFLSLLGWSPKDDSEVLPVDEIIRRFSLDGINRKSAVFDLEKCRWFSGQHLHHLPLEKLASLAQPVLESAAFPAPSPEDTLHILGLVREKVRTLAELPDWFAYFLDDDRPPEQAAIEKAASMSQLKDVSEALASALDTVPETTWDADSIKAAVMELASAQGIKPGKLLFPLRMLTTGRGGGPDLMPLLAWLGKDRTLSRLKNNTPLLITS